MKDPKMIWAWVGGLIVIIAVIAWIWWPKLPGGSSSPSGTNTAPAPVYAPQGQVVEGFPNELIIDSAAAVSGSYSINYSSSTDQYTTQYNSSDTVTSLYNQYLSFLPKDGWTVNATNTANPAVDAIVASRSGGQLQIIISTSGKGKGSQASVTYSTR